MTELSYAGRVKTLKKLRQALVEQRDSFYSYLVVLEDQEQAIMESDAEELERSVELEKTILRDILRVQRVIDPLASLYEKVGATEAKEIEGLQGSLTRLKGQVLRRNFENRRLLTQHVEELRAEVHRLRMPDVQAVFAAETRDSAAPLIDLTA
jgi:hypothetical protein